MKLFRQIAKAVSIVTSAPMSASPLSLDTFLPYRLSFTSNLVSSAIASAYEALFGLTIPEWRLIAVIAETAGVTQLSIGQRTLMDKVTVSRAAISLADRGLLARSPNAQDRRSHLLTLTQAGRELYAQVGPKALELEREIFASFAPGELALFTTMLRRIDAVLLARLPMDTSPATSDG